MKIDFRENYTRFGDLITGDCFKYAQGYYMKIETCKTEMHLVNAVDLKYGNLSKFGDNTEITYVNLKCVNADHVK